MPWGLWSYPPPGGTDDASSSASKIKDNENNKQNKTSGPEAGADAVATPVQPPPPPRQQKIPLDYMRPEKPRDPNAHISWNDSLNAIPWSERLLKPSDLLYQGTVIVGAIALYGLYRSHLRRIPMAGNIDQSFYRRRKLLGKVTSVGDGDNFRMFHTPGGRLAGWGWLRKVPTGKQELKGRTLSVRLAGVDAPETAHFGRPAQPFSAEALTFLRDYVLGKRVRAHIYRKDQYDRVVATVYVRKAPFFLKKDVGLEMLKRGLATTYEAKTGAEFGGDKTKEKYLATEAAARKRGKGLWSAETGGFFGFGKKKDIESPRAFKERMKTVDVKPSGTVKTPNGKTSSTKVSK
ncbi:nuclease domain-protein [Rhypophila decipiens]|uniref:Probable endonuclease LCL3 n=1 Tax=Rhypophila decipiens TaxID=261697 RepID=A0AAN6Y5C6_9PEZI|nr:nuclease domain-protein [Rhypophila decipiens]